MTAHPPTETVRRAVVLVVDDDPVNRLVARVLIEARGQDVLEAEDGEGALALLRAERGDVGLVLMDLEMPGMGGLAATRAIRALAPGGRTLPVVALTLHSDPETRRNCFDAGMNGFLRKPISAMGIESIVCLVGQGVDRAQA